MTTYHDTLAKTTPELLKDIWGLHQKIFSTSIDELESCYGMDDVVADLHSWGNNFYFMLELITKRVEETYSDTAKSAIDRVFYRMVADMTSEKDLQEQLLDLVISLKYTEERAEEAEKERDAMLKSLKDIRDGLEITMSSGFLVKTEYGTEELDTMIEKHMPHEKEMKIYAD